MHVITESNPAGNTLSPEQKGMHQVRFAGREVRVQESPGLQTENRQEEAGFAGALHRRRDPSRREFSEARQLNHLLGLQIKDILKAMPDLERAWQTLAQQQDQASARNASAWLAGLRQACPDIHLRFFLLHRLVHDLRKRAPRSGDLRRATSQLQQLWNEQGPALQAGWNTATTVSQEAAAGLAPALGRQLYVDAVHDFRHAADAWQFLSSAADRDLLTNLNFVCRALGDDLRAGSSSIDITRLKAVLNDLRQLHVLAELVGPARTGRPAGQAGLVPVLLGLVGQSPGDNGLTGLSLYARPQLLAMLRHLPGDQFASDEARQALLDEIQEGIDQAIIEERDK